jgi:acyl-CoA thioesterase YciA
MIATDGYELITRHLCLIKDTGHAGVLWGGNMMAWLDEAGAMLAGLLTKNDYMVTKAFTDIDFKRQVRPGDLVEFFGRVEKWGTTSLSLKIKVLAGRHGSEDRHEVLEVTGVFVAIGRDGRKTKIQRA